MDLRGEGGGGRGRRVVVIGGGVAGSLVAKSLHFFADVILIDPKEYFEITWASLRGMVEPSFVERSVIQHKDYLTNGRVIVSKAINITASDVLIEEEGPRRRLISYDYLVIATGHHDPLPLARKDRLNEYRAENEKIKESRSVLIVGGGPTGVELAAEIAVDYPGKKVTIVHDGHRLLDFIGPKASDKAMKWLKKRSVEVRLQQSVDMESWSDGSKTYVTSTGERIDADCHFLCTGKPLGSAWLNQSILKDCVDSFGMLKVDEYLRVKGHKNIFAIGDIMDTKELKQGYLAQKHALIAAKNIKMLINGEKESKMASYNPQSLKVIVSLGRHDAVAQFPFTTIIGLVPGLIKSKDLFVGKVRKQLGLDPQIVHY